MIAWLIVMMRRLDISQNLTGARNRAITTLIADWDVAFPATQLQWIELREVGACWPRFSKDHRAVLELVAIGVPPMRGPRRTSRSQDLYGVVAWR